MNNKYKNNNFWPFAYLRGLANKILYLGVTIVLLLTSNSVFAQQAVITGETAICYGEVVEINLSLAGTAPWSVTIQVNNSEGDFTNIYNNIYEQDTILEFDKTGEFYLIAASDNDGPITYSTDTIKTSLIAPLTEAIISGNRSICEESSYNARIDLNGNAPWKITYSYNGGTAVTVSKIQSSPYYLNISQEGTYSLLTVSDQNCTGTAVGTFTLSHYDKSTAYLVGGDEKCAEESTPLSVIFTGSAPYDMEYMIDDESAGTIEGINTTPFSFHVTEPGEYEILEFTDNNGCIGTSSGSATVSNYPDVEIQFVGLSSTYAINSNPVQLVASPSGGEFKGDGVVTSTSIFYPELAVEYGETPYEIIYSYENPTTGCFYSDTAEVTIIDSIANIFFPDDRDVFCSNEDPFIITGANIYEQVGTFSISGGVGLTNHGDNSATINPQVLGVGDYTITYTYWSGSSYDALERIISIEYVDEVFFILNTTEFCGNDSRIVLNGSELDGVFSGTGVESDTTDAINFYFNPKKASVGTNDLTFSYEAPSGCISKAIETVVVNDIPHIYFTTQDTCVNENSPLAIRFINQTESEDEITAWLWNFNDFGSSQNTSTIENPSHTYETADDYTVSLTATTSENCVATATKDIEFGKSPLSSFTFSSECLDPDTSILFVQTVTSNYDIVEYEWIFSDDVGTEYFYGDSIYYKFSLLDEYLVKLIAKTTQGCVDTVEDNIQLKPTFKIADGPYFQDFEVTNTYWENEFSKALNNNSWLFGSTEESLSKTTNNKAWYTQLEYTGEESSWIKSPCFNFEDIEKPFVKFDIWRDFEEVRDGANLQYTTDNGKTWNLVGTVDDGLNWYNSYQINGNPGGHDEGWTNIKDTKWVEVRHRLDELAGKTNIQFRIVYGSDGTNNENGGVSFDNIWFQERNHVVLLEHFTNTNDDLSLTEDNLINTLRLENINDLIDIQYHTDFPGSDPFNLINPLEVNARLLYYGSSTVPLSLLDGTDIYEYGTSDISSNDIIVKSLEESNFELELNTVVEDNTLGVDYSVKSLESTNDRDLYLYIVILEDSVELEVDGENIIFMNTFRKFLPDAGGILLQSDWDEDEEYSDSYTWDVDNVENVDNMKVALFLQDEDDNSVLQAVINKKLEPTVGIGNHKSAKLNKVSAYPNPFKNSLLIARNGISGELKMELISISGNVLHSSILEETESTLQFGYEIPSGLYFLRVTELETGYSESIRLIKY